MDDFPEPNAMVNADEPKSSAGILAAIKRSERAFAPWQSECDRIDEVYAGDKLDSAFADPDYDLFWASMEVLKPAIYAKPPQPVVTPQFKDRRKLYNTTAEMLERAVVSAFDRAGLDESMICTRDDLIFYNRGQLWVTYETAEREAGEDPEPQSVCIEHLDRKDFLHPPARKWSEVPWVARRAWMTREDMRERFEKTSGEEYKSATLARAPGSDAADSASQEHEHQAGVWEVWHRENHRVYWVADGCSKMLDEGKPHLRLRGFFPCPRPAYGTLRARSLEPVPDYRRYEGHFKKINSLTKRIYDLLDNVRMKGLIPAGGDVATAIEQALTENSDSMLLIPVPGAALLASGGTASFVQWLPIEQIAATITGLIQARAELFADYDRLSGISDIMRGETVASETKGAQQLKAQYGAARIREKVGELQRIARDVTQIAAEIMAEKFDKETLLEMSQMEIPSKADIERSVKEIEDDAEEELKKLADKAEQAAKSGEDQIQKAAASGEQVDPKAIEQQKQQAAQQFKAEQQKIIAKYGPMLKKASEQIPIEGVMGLLRDGRARGFAFEIATDSTIMTDEIAEKRSRGEFLSVFTQATQGLIALGGLGEGGAKLAGEMLKFALQPYRVGRELTSVIDQFADQAPAMAAQMGGKKGGSDAEQAMAQANLKLAEAEMQKAQASIAKVQVDAQKSQQDIQLRAMEAQAKTKEAEAKFALDLQKTQGDIAETQARIDKIMAEIQKLGVDANNQTRTQEREDVKVAVDVASSRADRERQAMERDRAHMMGERQQSFSERQVEVGKDRG